MKLFGDVVLESNEDGRFVPTYKNAQVLRAVPYDVPQIGYKNGVINNLRLCDVEIFNSQTLPDKIQNKGFKIFLQNC